jgi:2-hydroxy-6-oxonona-2,4-dienedioate hydrolase
MALTSESTSRYLDLPSGKVHFNEAGEGYPLLLLHGSGPGATGWSNFGGNIVALAEHFRCYALDLPGWGRSYSAAPDERDYVRIVLEFLDALGIERAAFIGNSLGGVIAIRFAVEHAARQSHLVAMGSAVSGAKLFSAADGPSEGLKVLRRAYEQPGMDSMRELVDVMVFDAGDQAETIAQERLEALLANPDHIANFLASEMSPREFPGEEAIAGIASPTLLIHGRDDRVLHYEHSLKLLSLIPDARLALFNRCGHWAQVERVEEFNRLVTDFVTNN